MAQLKQVVDAPQARPPKQGIVAAAPIIDDATFRFAGFRFLPERCADGGRLAIECEGDTSSMALGGNPAVVDGDSFVVFTGDTCSTMGSRGVDLEDRARRHVEIVQSFQIAAELWGGSLNLDAKSLASVTDDTLTSGAGSAVDALAAVDWGIGHSTQGQQGMVHMTPQVLDHLVSVGPLRREGGLWLTPMDNIVVADAGYPGTGPNGEPAGASQWIYGSTMIYLRLGAIAQVSTKQAELIDRSVNTIEYWAWRPVAWEWDECGHVAAEVNIAVPAFGGTS